MEIDKLILTMILMIILLAAAFITAHTLLPSNPTIRDFYFGVEFAYDNVTECKKLVDKVKNYTNLFVVGSLDVTLNETKLNEVADYIYEARLKFIVFFISPRRGYNYHPYIWVIKAREKYEDQFLGAYAYDEPGGNQLDHGSFMMVKEAENYTEASETFVHYLHSHIEYYVYPCNYSNAKLFTADYGLYWYDYEAGYDVVLAEYGWNHSRPLTTALCRGAAKVQEREWGIIITWTYQHPPYIESADKLYADLVSAYHAGARYIVVFNYPKITEYGVLTQEHLQALEKFWSYVKRNPEDHGSTTGNVAYILPQHYGFGFRSINDSIWGLWPADELAEGIWKDVDYHLGIHQYRLDIVYDNPKFTEEIKTHYDEQVYWNGTRT